MTASGGDLTGLNATVTLSFSAGQDIADNADNALSNTTPTSTNDNTYAVDNTAPTLAVTGVPPTSGAAFTATFTFSEGVTGFALADIAVGNATASAFMGSSGDTVYTALITPASDGTVTVDVAAGAAADAAGNSNAAAPRATSTYTAPVVDNTAPRVTSIVREGPSTSPTNADRLTWRVTFSEDVKNVDAADFSISGTTATLAVAAVSGSTSRYDVTASGGTLAGLNAAVTLSFSAGQDIADNADNALSNTTPTSTNDNTYTVDNTAPTLAITGVPPTSAAAFTATFTFSEGVTGFALADIAVGNATASAFMGSSGDTVYTALITPASDGTVTVDVAAGAAADAAGNSNAAAPRATSTYTAPVVDNTAPQVASIVRQDPSTSPTNENSLTWRVTFSEDVKNVDAADFSISGATAALAVAAVSGSTSQYDVTASGGTLAGLDAAVTLSFSAGQDIADNADNALSNTTPTGTNDNEYVLDNTAPTLAVTGVPPTSAAAFTATFTFSEGVTGFALADIAEGNATASAFMGSSGDTAYTALITPASAGTVTVDVAAGAAADAAGNSNAAAPRATSTYTAPVVDNTAPRVTSIVREGPSTSPTNADRLTWRVTFSEDVKNVDAADFSISGATAALAVAAVSGSTSRYDVTASGGDLTGLNATVTLSFAGTQDIADNADNALSNTTPTSTNDNTYAVDNTAPTLAVTGVPPTSGAAFTATFTFSEGVTGFALADIAVGNATASAFMGSSGDTAYTALITPASDGTVTVDVAAGAAADAAGNSNAAAPRATSTYTAPVVDNTAPRVTSIVREGPSTSPTNENSLTWRVTFSEDVKNVDAADFSISGTTATLAVAAVSGSTSRYDVTASGGDLTGLNATVTLSFAGTQDIADNADNALSNTTPTSTNDNTYAVDNTAPTLAITGVPPTSAAAFTATFTFSEGVTGFALADIAEGNATASEFAGSDGDTAYTALITPASDGTVTVDVAAAAAVDAAGNGNAAAPRVTSTYTAPVVDNTAPRVTSIVREGPSTSPTNADRLTWRVTFSEDVKNVDAADFSISGATATLAVAAVSGSTSRYDVTASGGNLTGLNATVTLSFAGTQDIADNADNALSNTTPTGTNDNTYTVDNTAPTVAITGVPPTSAAAFTATFTFSEGVTGFVLADIAVGNATASAFMGSSGDTVYTALITPASDGTVTVDVAAAAAADAAGNGNAAAPQATSTYTAPVVDTTAPQMASIALSPMMPEVDEDPVPQTRKALMALPDKAVHGPGATLTFTLTFDRDVTVTLDPETETLPEIVLDVFGRERRAKLTGDWTDTRTLTFQWTVKRGDYDPDGLEVRRTVLNGATIKDSQGRDTAPETFPSGQFKAHRVRGGFFAMSLDVEGPAREGQPFTVRVVRDGGLDEGALAIVQATDSGDIDSDTGQPRVHPLGIELHPEDSRADLDGDAASGSFQLTPRPDGAAGGGRTITFRLVHTNRGGAGGDPVSWYDAKEPVEVMVAVIDAGLATDVPSLLVGPSDAFEQAGETLRFEVRLMPESTGEVTVDYATADGTAAAGADYVATSGTLTFAPGETEKTAEVEVLSDEHDEGIETVWLMLSNPVGAKIERGRNFGQIHNSGPIPKAWISRFGRSVAEQVLDAVEGRMQAARQPGAAVTLAGETIALGSLFGTESGSGGDGHVQAEARREAEAQREAKRLADWLKGDTDPAEERRQRSRTATGRELLTGSSFALSAETAGKDLVSLWGRTAVSRFDGREGELTVDGEVVTGMLGTDWTRGSGAGAWSAGLIVSHSAGEGGYRGAPAAGDGGSRSGASGKVEAVLSSLFPWGRHALTERLEAWGAAGVGAGELTVTPKLPGTDEDGVAIRVELDLRMATAGLRGTLLDGGGGGITLTGKTDAMAVQTASGRGRGADGGNLESARATVTRLRLGLEASRPVALGSGAGSGAGSSTMLTPRLEVGVRHDGGDAETGFGLDLGAGLALSDPARGLEAELRGRGLLSHGSKGFRERGFSGALAWRQRPSSDSGAKLTLTQTVGGSSSGGADALLARTTLEGLAANDNDNGAGNDDLASRRLELKFGYGVPAFGGRVTWTPELGAGFSDAGRDLSLGWRLERGGSEGDGGWFGLSFEATRREAASGDGAEHGVMLRGTMRW